MKMHIRTLLATAGLGLAVTALSAVSAPTDTGAYSLIGGNLSLSQRDFRVFNNFTDSTANNNVTPHPNFPGQTGAVMAIWKGCAEWASEPVAGNGLGDGLSSNSVIGDGGANFDASFQGTANSAGTNNANIHSELAGSSGGTLAFMQGPISDGWTIKYYSGWTWHDGPNNVTSGIDLQGVACHEFGHALGLGHSNVSGATMWPSISGTGTGQRSISSDDIAGVQAVYGAKSASKPRITSLAGVKQTGGTLIINGSNYSTTGNEVWFTNDSQQGNPVKVTGVASTGGGTQISVTVPAGVMDGEVMVKNSGGSHVNLSNAFPIDLGAPFGDPPVVSSILPTSGPAGGYTNVTVTGTGFTGTVAVRFGGVDAVSFVVNSNTSITAQTPPGSLGATVSVEVIDVEGSDTLPSAFTYTTNPAPSISSVSPPSGTKDGGTVVVISGASVLGVTSVTFDGIAGTDLELAGPTELTVTTPAHALGAVDVVAFGNGSSSIPGGFTYINTGSFLSVGTGVAGTLGTPQLLGFGDLAPGSSKGFTIETSGTLSFVNGTMFVAIGPGGAAPFKGGTFYPIPIVLQFLLLADAQGVVSLSSSMPLGTPSGTKVTLQAWFNDLGAPFLLSATNGLTMTTP